MINERLTKAIAVPEQSKIKLEDGRSLLITAWKPVVKAGGIVRLKAEFIMLNEHGQASPVNKGQHLFECPPSADNYSVEVPIPTVRIEIVEDDEPEDYERGTSR